MTKLSTLTISLLAFFALLSFTYHASFLRLFNWRGLASVFCLEAAWEKWELFLTEGNKSSRLFKAMGSIPLVDTQDSQKRTQAHR